MGSCAVEWRKQTTPEFGAPADSIDVLCAFSVFTHMEHEDAFRYLLAARRIVRPGGKFVLSCLPMNLEVARSIFEHSANLDVSARWASVRNVTTSVDYMDAVARLAGWEVFRWYRGDEPNVRVEGRGHFALGQSTCVLRRP